MKKLILICISVIATFTGQAQDVHFSQFWNNSIQYNPAMAGVFPANLRVATFYRKQWSSIASPYSTYGVNADTRIETNGNTSIGIGLNIFKDEAGDLNLGTTNAQLAVSSIISLNAQNKLSIGVNGGIIQKGIDASGAEWNSQYQNGSFNGALDPAEDFTSMSEVKGDVSAGIVYAYSSNPRNMTSNDRFNAIIGISYNHIIRPKYNWIVDSPDALYGNLVAHAEFLIGIENSKWSVLPAVIAQFQGPSKELLIGSRFRYRLKDASRVTGFAKGIYMYVGGFLRSTDAFIPSVGFELDVCIIVYVVFG